MLAFLLGEIHEHYLCLTWFYCGCFIAAIRFSALHRCIKFQTQSSSYSVMSIESS